MVDIITPNENRIREEGRSEGRLEGRLEGTLEGRILQTIHIYRNTLHMDDTSIAGSLIQEFALSEAEVRKYMDSSD